jgi:hypothetical protein
VQEQDRPTARAGLGDVLEPQIPRAHDASRYVRR